jgi:6-phosphogluconate dehydrogenase
LLFDEQFADALRAAEAAWRKVVVTAASLGVPAPAMSASLAYYDALRASSLPQNLTQAQRDAFGAHTYVRRDDRAHKAVHTEWLKAAKK